MRWDALVALEDLLSTVQQRNPADLTPVPCSLELGLRRLHEVLGREAEPPRTLLIALSERLLPHLPPIFEQPRRLLRRERVMQPPHQLRMMDTRCRRWYARQPGITPLEKAGAKQRLMGVVRSDRLDVVENRVLRAVLDRLALRAEAYVAQYGTDHADHPNLRVVRRLQRANCAFREHPELREVRPVKGSVQPTNALLKHAHYRPVWGVFTALHTEEERVARTWTLQHTLQLELLALTLQAHIVELAAWGMPACFLMAPEPGGADRSRLELSAGLPSVALLGDDGLIELAVGAPSVPPGPQRDDLAVMAHARSVELGRVVLGRRESGETRWLATPSLLERKATDRSRLRQLLDHARQWLACAGAEPPAWAGRAAPLEGLRAACACGHRVYTGVGKLGGGVASLRVGQGSPATASSAQQDPVITGEPVVARGMVHAEHRVGRELWDCLASGDERAARDILACAFQAASGFLPDRVLVVPDQLDPRAISLLERAFPPTGRRWLLPRSVAVALRAAEADILLDAPAGEPISITVLNLGGPTAEICKLELHRGEGDAPEFWHWPPNAPLRWRPECLIDAILSSVNLTQARHIEARAALLGVPDLYAWLEEPGSRRLPVPGEQGWWELRLEPDRIVRVAREQALVLLDELRGRPELAVGRVLVEGWPLRLHAFRDALGASSSWILLDDPSSAARGAERFLQLHLAGEPTYLEVLPHVELGSADIANRRRTWTTVLEDQLLRPGKELILRRRRFGCCPPGRSLDAWLPLRVGGLDLPFVARWRRDDLVIREALYFHVDVHWRAGQGGLSLRFVPEQQTTGVPAHLLEWSGAPAEDEDRIPENCAPCLPARGHYGSLDVACAAADWKDVRAQITPCGLAGAATKQHRRSLVSLADSLPHREWRQVDSEAMNSWQELQAEALPVIAWALGAASDAPKKDRRRLLAGLDNKLYKLVEPEREHWLRLAEGFGPCLPPGILTRIAQILDDLPLHPRKGTRRTKETCPAAWLRLAGRAAGEGEGRSACVRQALVRLGASAATDPELREPWAWALGTALFSNEGFAGNLEHDEVEQLTTALLAMGDILLQAGDCSDAWGEVCVALLGLLRVRAGHEATRGPSSEWSRQILCKIESWRTSLPPEVLARPLRIQFATTRDAWCALDEFLRGFYLEVVLTETAQ